ncbi:IucA/IucC family C-terminal-domain containing protein [Sporosarcina cyprini]|uniref:IucA/IucC family C-terminal-domain containing protein n=1 Tax=Sporosarcina cyprini TaxID=2910523 RepID=UPI001EDD3627|nr:IucA/IucC family C-terminal-domain containing protein [Sporosarcina cyprini]MCG3086669.1 hypothetical protein [Sporosarcina cyprini]
MVTDEQRQDLERFALHVNNDTAPLLLLDDLLKESGIDRILELTTELSGAPTEAVAASVYMRRHGFFMAGLFLSISQHQIMWRRGIDEVGIFLKDGLIHYAIPETAGHPVTKREEALRSVLDQWGHPFVEALSKRAKISKWILWENVWGYVIWMYANLDSPYKDADLNLLLQDDSWKPAMRRSPFQRYLQGETVEEASQYYKRTTCCLYKELPDTDMCPYCPLRVNS